MLSPGLWKRSYGFSFSFINTMHYTDWLSNVKAISPSRNNLRLVVRIFLFINDCFIPFSKVSPRAFASRLMRDMGPRFSFWWYLYLGLHPGWMLASAYVRKYSFLNFLKSLQRTGIISSLNVWYRCLGKPSGPSSSLCGEVLSYKLNFFHLCTAN